MKPAICTQCGASIEVDENKEVCYCPNCGTKFVTEKIINNNITNNNYTIENATIKMGDLDPIEEEKRFVAFYAAENFDKCFDVANALIDQKPYEPMGYFLMIRLITEDFTIIAGRDEYLKCMELKGNYEKYASEKAKQILDDQMDPIISNYIKAASKTKKYNSISKFLKIFFLVIGGLGLIGSVLLTILQSREIIEFFDSSLSTTLIPAFAIVFAFALIVNLVWKPKFEIKVKPLEPYNDEQLDSEQEGEENK